jgi:hypothetical protein
MELEAFGLRVGLSPLPVISPIIPNVMALDSQIRNAHSIKWVWYVIFTIFLLIHLFVNWFAVSEFPNTLIITSSFFIISAEQSHISILQKRLSVLKFKKIILFSFLFGILIPYLQYLFPSLSINLLFFGVYGAGFYIEQMDNLGKELAFHIALVFNGLGYIFVALTLYCGFLNLSSVFKKS